MSSRPGFIMSPSFVAPFSIALLCLIVSMYGYRSSPPQKPDSPPDVLFRTDGGDVIFSHAHHYHDSGAAIGCSDCHHNYDKGSKDSVQMNCRICHYHNRDIVETVCSDDPVHPRCIGKQCAACHEGEACTFCHRTSPR